MKTMMKALLASAVMMAGCGSATADDHGNLSIDLSTPEGAVLAGRKVACSTIEGKDVIFHWEGEAYSRRTGERDKHLFDVEGMNVRSCTSVSDPDRGEGWKLVSREILLYLDKDTGEVLKTWENPWTGEDVEVFHVANDPVNFGNYTKGRDGKPATSSIRIDGDKWFQTTTFPLYYPNPLGGDYQPEVGGTYHATEMFNFMGSVEDLMDADKDTAEAWIGWVRMSDWLPWMRMAGRDGVIYFHTSGRKIDSFDALSERMRGEIATNYPEYTTAPPDDDPRRNMTSWKHYKQIIEARKAE
jgi:hypothetical protein